MSTPPENDPGKTPDEHDPYSTSGEAIPRPGVSTATFYPDEAAGTMIGPYKLLQLMGKGGMGAVWMAEQTEPVQRRVAVKIIKGDLGSKEILARFEAERQALAMMDHPNIARVLDAGMVGEYEPRPSGSGNTNPLPNGRGSPERPYFVMELVKGIPFTKYCDQEHLTPKERLELFIPVCNAVQHAHQKGIIHRDLKPSNVLIALYDGKAVPKVIDFGIAKATHQKLTEKTMFTEVGQIIGTLEYMAPEQAELNNLDIDTRADIYSLGVMLYEILTGAPPFSAQQLRSAAFTEMLRMIREVEPAKPSTKLSNSEDLPAIAAKRKLEPKKLTGMVQGDLDWIVMKCLEKDRGRRYETANQLGEELGRFLADEPVQAGPPSVSYRATKFLRRNKGPVLAAVLVLLALVAGIIGTSIGLWVAERERRVAEKAVSEEKLATKKALAAAKAEKEARDAAEKAAEAERLANKKALAALLTSANNLAAAHHKAGQLTKAVPLFEETLARRKTHLGPDHPDTLTSLGNLAVAYLDTKNPDKAVPLFDELLDAYRKQLGADDPRFAGRLAVVALEFLKHKEHGVAEPMLRECIEIRVKSQPDEASTFNAKSLLGACLLGQKKYGEAEPLLKEGYEGMKQREQTISPEAKVRLTEALERLVQLYDATGNAAEAERWRKELAERRVAQKEPKKGAP